MIQDIKPRIFSNAYEKREVYDEAIALVYQNQKILLRQCEGTLSLPTIGDVNANCDAQANPLCEISWRYAFSISEQACFLAETEVSNVVDETFVYCDLAVLRTMQPMWMAFIGITGSQLYRFYKRNTFCGNCGSKKEHSETERAMVCPSCQDIQYPYLSPAVIVAVTNGNQLLMTKYAQRPYTNYALIAGFVELGETLEQCVIREVKEEVGIDITNIRYYKSQPWAFSDSLLVGFFAELQGSPELTIDTQELSEAQWIDREQIPEKLSNISLTQEMIEVFRSSNTMMD